MIELTCPFCMLGALYTWDNFSWNCPKCGGEFAICGMVHVSPFHIHMFVRCDTLETPQDIGFLDERTWIYRLDFGSEYPWALERIEPHYCDEDDKKN